jgi:hypothetical protein
MVIGPQDAIDTSVFIDPQTGYYWYFNQAPAIGSANYVYLRGINTSPAGTQSSRVYLYYVESDQVLNPAQWQSSGFTVNGVAQNWVNFSGQAQYQILLTDSAVLWTPPAPATSGVFYYLIVWIDNTSPFEPPAFAKLPAFADMQALATYVQSSQTMVFLNTLYNGAFLRQFPGQTVSQEGTGQQTSPDIIISGNQAIKDVSALTTPASYSSGTLSQTVVLEQRNFVYLRALNTIDGAAKARVYLFWATVGQLSPTSWSPIGFTVAGIPQNWIDLTAESTGQVLISTVPVVWSVAGQGAGQYVLIAYVDNTSDPQPPDFTPFGYIDASAITQFVATHPQLSWLAVNTTTAAQPSLATEYPFKIAHASKSLYIGIQFSKIPTDGVVNVSIPGPDGNDTVVATSMHIPDANATVMWPVSYTAGFASSIAINYWQGATNPPQGANIVGLMTTGTPLTILSGGE